MIPVRVGHVQCIYRMWILILPASHFPCHYVLPFPGPGGISDSIFDRFLYLVTSRWECLFKSGEEPLKHVMHRSTNTHKKNTFLYWSKERIYIFSSKKQATQGSQLGGTNKCENGVTKII